MTSSLWFLHLTGLFPEACVVVKQPFLIAHLTYLVTTSDRSALFERLRQIEIKCSGLVTASPQAGSQGESITLDDHGFAIRCSVPPLPSTESPGTQSTISGTSKTETDSIADEPTSSCSANCPTTPANAPTLLKQAFDQVLDLKRQNLNKQTTYLNNHVQPELSKACIKSKDLTISAHQLLSLLTLVVKPGWPPLTDYVDFFKHYKIDTFPGFINIKLMHLIPDIIDMPEISIDPAVLVVYYSILYHGSLTTAAEMTQRENNFTHRMYLCCLRTVPTWQRQIAGTKTDLIAAILIVCYLGICGPFLQN